MTPGLATPPVDAPADPSVAAAYLENLIDTQPVCLLRVDIEGQLLAGNAATLKLLGAQDHSHVLGKPLAERIASEYHEDWKAFLTRAWNDGLGSLESEMVDLKGGRRVVLLQAVAQRSTLDGVPSLIVTAQDISVRRRLESTLERQQAVTGFDDFQRELRQMDAERQRLTHLLDEHDAGARQAIAMHAALRAESERVLAEAAASLEEMTKTVAAYRVELAQIMDNNVRNLEPMAAAGRIAATVARDVQSVIVDVDARTRDLLTTCSPQATYRQDVEKLRGSFLSISSLIRQLIQATGGTAP